MVVEAFSNIIISYRYILQMPLAQCKRRRIVGVVVYEMIVEHRKRSRAGKKESGRNCHHVGTHQNTFLPFKPPKVSDSTTKA
jgi:hypothetical protein